MTRDTHKINYVSCEPHINYINIRSGKDPQIVQLYARTNKAGFMKAQK